MALDSTGVLAAPLCNVVSMYLLGRLSMHFLRALLHSSTKTVYKRYALSTNNPRIYERDLGLNEHRALWQDQRFEQRSWEGPA